MNRILGPPSYENWKSSLSSETTAINGFEVPLFTDAHITGEIEEGFGPYQFLNPIAIPRLSDSIMPGVFLRIENRLELHSFSSEEMSRTDSTYYHGGILQDEIAALASLILGVRFKSGGETREFNEGEDPRGKPILYKLNMNPILLLNGEKLIIPNARRTINLKDLDKLLSYPTLSPGDAIILIKAARIYQDAIWIAESEPELAWIMFVSAIETVANHWSTVKATPVEKLHASMPELEDVLFDQGGEAHVEAVANLVVPYMGATKKFVDFVMNFRPQPPVNRSRKHLRYSWDEKEIEKTLKMIYKYRSGALHGGSKFPAPMCYPPMIFDGMPGEVPIGLATMANGGVWKIDDTPILLHTFEHIVRGALLKWWISLVVPELN